MKKLFIVANWKSNKTVKEAEEWMDRFTIYDLRFKNKEIIICSPFTALLTLKSYILNHKSPVSLGAQDISPFDEGAYTGEINGKQIKELADYVIVGHSERRQNLGEDDRIVSQKIDKAFKYKLIPILCISDINQILNLKSYVLNRKVIVAYEPLFAIGSGNPDTPQNADEMAKKIKDILGQIPVLYGGSVTSKNIKNFTQILHIDGVLVGGASLDPQEFLYIIKNA